MELQINDKYRIKGDDSQWILYAKTTDKDGNLTAREHVVGYYHDLSRACTELVKRQIRTCNAMTLNEALQAIERIIEDVTSAFSPEFIITVRPKNKRK